MRLSFVLALTIFGNVALTADFGNFKVSTLKAIVDDPKQLDSYMECMTRDIGCDSEKSRLKDMLLAALKNGCDTCDRRQKIVAKELIRYIKNKHPARYAEFCHVHDPQNVYRKNFEEFIRKPR